MSISYLNFLSSLGISESNYQWVGAWWLGYVIFAIMCFAFALPIFGYANDLPGASSIRAAKINELSVFSSSNLKERVDVYMTIWKLLHNTTFLLICLFSLCDMFVLCGLNSFGPKLIELLMFVSPTFAGFVFLPAGALGTLIGGYIINKFKMHVCAMMKFQLLLSIAVIAVAPTIFSHCPSNNLEYQNCSCVSSSDQRHPDGHGKPCSKHCKLSYIFVVGYALIFCFACICLTTTVSITFRVIQPYQATAALSMQTLLVKISGTVPSPLIFGVALDSSCFFKDVQSRHMKIENQKVAKYIFLILLVPKVISVLAMAIMISLHKSNSVSKNLIEDITIEVKPA
ncbi:hypothetical protein HELRODRAFT_164356 [Helobdella robusta]|uniref:Uncharacterized protein n=1 Tax=Helobdella robusta TaxID=6412 RepID=T1EVB2_HELRO|nr:hypothetical protein HELRODRAFT_164356 [Helobdella robusta]ESN94498.1 hypothetical protein HELRODRAFT_164356 [Helobdella robusta]